MSWCTKKENTKNKQAQSYPRFISNKPCGKDKFEGKSHERVVDAIAQHISNSDNSTNNESSNIIGLEGEWGSGKSNVIKQLSKHKQIGKNYYYLFEYDAWGLY